MNLAKPVYDDLGITEKKEKAAYKFIFKNNLDQSTDMTPNNVSPRRSHNDHCNNSQDNFDELFKGKNIYNNEIENKYIINRYVNERKGLKIDITESSEDEEDRLNREM